MTTGRGKVKLANEIASRRAKLSDADHAVHAAYLFGGVTKHMRLRRGVLCVRWGMGGGDVTQSMTRLTHAYLVETTPAIDEGLAVLRPIIMRKLVGALARTVSRSRKGKP